MGREIVRGSTQAILERYRKNYPNRDAMGTLTFSEIEVRPLVTGLVLVTGKYELKRTAAGGGPAWGRYTLIVRQCKDGWKIIHDHTTTY
jgi:ketosteroid isomerase-like protein